MHCSYVRGGNANKKIKTPNAFDVKRTEILKTEKNIHISNACLHMRLVGKMCAKGGNKQQKIRN